MAQNSVVGLVFPYNLGFCRGALQGIRRFVETRPDWSCLLVGPETSSVRSLMRMKPAGLIAFVFKPSLRRMLSLAHCPIVNVCNVLPDTDMARVGSDDTTIGKLAATHLLERGLQHFAFLGHLNHAGCQRRESSFEAKVLARGGSYSKYLPPETRNFSPDGHIWALSGAFRRWLRSLPKPVGIFACFDMWAFQLAEACQQLSLRVPEEVLILGMENDELLCQLARPSLSSVAIPTAKIGYEAAAMLASMLDGRAAPKQPLLLPPQGVVVRRSSDIFSVADGEVARAIRFIHDNCHERICVSDVIQAVPVSRRLLEKRFRALRGRGIGEEIRQVRVERAKNLLQDAGLPIAGVARHSGFSDTRHLIVAFRRATGMTPTAYRRGIIAGPAMRQNARAV